MTQQTHNIETESTTSQKAEILEFLLTGCALTSLDALKHFRCFRLSARINDLRRDGWGIQTKMVTTENGKQIAEYRL